MKHLVALYAAFPFPTWKAGWTPKAGWILALLGALVLGSAPSGTAQSRPQDREAPAERAGEQDGYLASRGFYRRRAGGNGWFLARPAPEITRSRTLSDVLRTVPGVNVFGQVGGARAVSHRQARACPMAVFVDGLYTTIRNVDELTLEDVEALEVYRGPSEVPLEFTAPLYEGTCGALLVWSRMELSDE